MSLTMDTTFDETMTTLGIAKPPALWREHWERAQADFPADSVFFLADGFLDEVNGVCRFPDDIMAVLREVSAVVRGDERLSRLAWLWHSVVFRAEKEPEVNGWPNPASMGPLAEMFSATVILSGFPKMFAFHRERGIPAQVTHDTCRDLELWMRQALRYTGAWGFTRLGWMIRHCYGRLFRLGRLQFMAREYSGPSVYRHRSTGEVIALSQPDICYRRDGLVDGTNDRTDEQAWTATLEEDGDVVRGYPIHPAGFAQPEQVTLRIADWKRVLATGDHGYDMHIPEDGKMDHTLCGKSLQQALAFFPRYFPEKPPAQAFFCYSWLFDPQYGQLLSPESNIVRFQREFYNFPLRSDDLDPFFRVFGSKPADLTAAPRDTTLRRAMLDHTLAGNAFRGAAGFMLIDELDWGSQRYWRGLPE